MTEEEAKGLKKGDAVLVRMVVMDDGLSSIRVRADDHDHDSIRVLFEAIHSVLPRPLEVGDRVERIVDHDQLGTMSVLCVHGEKAWLAGKWGPLTVPLKNLRRVSQ